MTSWPRSTPSGWSASGLRRVIMRVGHPGQSPRAPAGRSHRPGAGGRHGRPGRANPDPCCLDTALTDQLARVDSLFLRLDLLVLLVVVFLPFPTGLIADALRHADNGAERVYVTLYGLTLLVIRLLGSALGAYARHQHLYAPKEEGEELHSTQRKFLPVVIGYVITILIGLAWPTAAVVLYFGIAVYLVVPFRDAARVLIRRHRISN